MTKGLEETLNKSAQWRLDELKANLDRAEREIFPAYREQFAAYRNSVLTLLNSPENRAVADDPQVLATIEASNQKVVAGLSNQAWNIAKKRVRWAVREAANDNPEKIKNVA